MAPFYVAADEQGWHRPVNRSEAGFDCVRAVADGREIEWIPALDSARQDAFVARWASGDALSEDWIPSAWLMRVWDSPAMAAAENAGFGLQTRLFGVVAQPVEVGESCVVAAPEVGLAGVDRFRVAEELPGWWLFGPCGREVQALLAQALVVDLEPESVLMQTAWIDAKRRALEVIDGSLRVGAYSLVQAVLDSPAVASHRELALRAALGFLVKDIWFEASLLYDPWVEQFGLPDLTAVANESSRAYPATP